MRRPTARTERGDAGLLGSFIVVVAVLVVLQLFGVDWGHYLTAAVDWCADVIRDLGGDPPKRR